VYYNPPQHNDYTTYIVRPRNRVGSVVSIEGEAYKSVPCRVGRHAAWDAMPRGTPCRVGRHAAWDADPLGMLCPGVGTDLARCMLHAMSHAVAHVACCGARSAAHALLGQRDESGRASPSVSASASLCRTTSSTSVYYDAEDAEDGEGPP
jgi:hypothetical protein